MPLKVVHVITGLGRGGSEGVLYRLVDATRADHAQVVVSLTDEGVYGERFRALGVPVHALGLRAGRPDVDGFNRLIALLRELQPDVVQTWLYHADLLGGLAARRAGCSAVIWTIRNLDLQPKTLGWGTRAVVAVNALLSRWVPRLIVYNSERARAAHESAGYAADRAHVVANGFDVVKFRPDPAARVRLRAEWGVPADMPLIGCVARGHPHKDHPNLLRALELIDRDFRCVLVGDGLDGFRGSNVTVVGPRDDIPAVMNALDIHVLPSASEAFPNAVGEAMACGTPCVATDVGDAAQLVGDTGLIVVPGDPEMLADALRSLIDAGIRRSDDARARIVRGYTLERMVQTYRALWQAAA